MIFVNLIAKIIGRQINRRYSEYFDRLQKSERRFKEYLEMSPEERIEKYEMLRKAIFRIQDILSEIELADYKKVELLNGDCLYADVYIIPYLDQNRKLSFIKSTDLSTLKPIHGEYKVVDYQIGKYNKNGIENISMWLAVDYSLTAICHRWLNEISSISEAIINAKKLEEDEC